MPTSDPHWAGAPLPQQFKENTNDTGPHPDEHPDQPR
jgi:hypothetical protein